MSCTMCGGLGWVLDGKADKAPLLLELLPCLLPDCVASGRPVALLSLNGAGFTTAVPHPTKGSLMSVATC